VRYFWLFWVLLPLALGSPIDDFTKAAQEKFGESGATAAKFLVDNMPPADKSKLGSAYLLENLEFALKARGEFPWAKSVPEALFLNDVLPYAVFDEPRDSWRPQLYSKAKAIVQGARTATEAALALNRDLFKLIQVHYNTGRKRPNQSLTESVQSGKATCSGLSIILVEACRAVGIPARAVGTPMWTNERGNHTWVEIWDGDWHFAGADEYDPAGLDRGWFVGDASKAEAHVPRHSIYATSWKRDGLAFPMVWARSSDAVAAVNVTPRYAASSTDATGSTESKAKVGVRLLARAGGSRLVGKVKLIDLGGQTLSEAETKAGRADLNDMPRLEVLAGTQGWLRFSVGRETREFRLRPVPAGESTVEAVWSELKPVSPRIAAIEEWLALPLNERSTNAPAVTRPLRREEADRATELIAANQSHYLASEHKAEFEAKSISLQGKTLRWMARTFGEAPAGGHSLWISMHGGGNAPPEVNDQQWQNQIKLYEPAEGIYVAPRAPTDTWNLWHEGHIDPLFQRLIDDYVVVAGVNPDRVYLMGYSAGGDGVWQLAPRMADRFAAAAMMAGHPNEASLLGLRNLPFAIFMGANDSAYNRNRIARERAAELDRLEKADPGGYIHESRIYEGLSHWMERKDAEALPWMAQYQRHPWPKKVVWVQDDILHSRFYWLELENISVAKEKQKIVASIDGQLIHIDGDIPPRLELRLSDELVSLEKPITVVVNGKRQFSGKVPRQAGAILHSLAQRADPHSAATALLKLDSATGQK